MNPDRIRQLVEALPVGVFILDAAGNAVYENAAAASLIGSRLDSGVRAETLAETYHAVIAGTDEPYPTERMPVVRALGGEASRVDDLEVIRDGERITLEATATPIFDADGEIILAVAVFQDISERRRAQTFLHSLNAELERQVAAQTHELSKTIAALEQEISTRRVFERELAEAKVSAERANAAKTLLLMNVSHELRTPLNHIIGFSDIIAGRVDDARTRGLAENTGASGRDLLQKVNDIITFAALEGEPPAPDHVSTGLERVLRQIEGAGLARFTFETELGAVRGTTEDVQTLLDELFEAAAEVDAPVTVRVACDEPSAAADLTFASHHLANRLRATSCLFGEAALTPGTRFHQQQFDLGMAVARARARRLGGDITSEGDDSVHVTLLLSSG